MYSASSLMPVHTHEYQHWDIMIILFKQNPRKAILQLSFFFFFSLLSIEFMIIKQDEITDKHIKIFLLL